MVVEDGVLLKIHDYDINERGEFIFQKGVTSIGNRAFKNCSNLRQITVPKGVTSIGGRAFENCNNLARITIPKGVTSIGNSAFENCSNLRQITIPKGVTSIGDSAFENCSNLRQITIPKGVTSIGNSAFENCSNLRKITIPKGVTRIGKEAFYACKSLSKITISNEVTSIEYGLFCECSSLSRIIIPKKVTSIEYGAFYGCNSLSKVIIPKGVKSIGRVAFEGCSSLSNITLPKEITSIGDFAFERCSSLSKIAIPKGVTKIGDSVFAKCSSLSEIIIPEGVKSIGSGAFEGCSSLSNITFPKEITSIGDFAFDGCSSLSEITIPKGVTSIGNASFAKCSRLSEITIPKGVTSIENWAFLGCSSLSQITIPEGVTEIGDNAFDECNNLNNLEYSKKNKCIVISQREKLTSKNKYIPIPYLPYLINNGKFQEFIDNADFLTFNSNISNLPDKLNEYSDKEKVNFFKFAVNLGCFKKDKVVDKNGKETEVTIGQKASPLLAKLLNTQELGLGKYYEMFDSMPFEIDTSLEFLKFITPQGKKNENLELLFNMENEYPGLFAKIMSNFHKAKQYRTTLAENGTTKTISWEEAFKKFYMENKYSFVTEETQDIAEVYASKGLNEAVFQEATKLREKSKKNNIPEHILSKQIKELSMLEQIEELKQKTSEEIGNSRTLIENLYKKCFTYEWLSKNDPRNGILGIFVSCCGTITSKFYGKQIAEASITQKDVQNLVVKDKNGEIISKGTIYVNEQSGYGVFNDFELNQKYREHERETGIYESDDKQEEQLTESEKRQRNERDLIFAAFQRGIQAFAEEYDKEHPNKPLKQINVGMGYNRLKRNVMQFEEETQLLAVPAEYGFKDALKIQHILYKKEGKNINKENNKEER